MRGILLSVLAISMSACMVDNTPNDEAEDMSVPPQEEPPMAEEIGPPAGNENRDPIPDGVDLDPGCLSEEDYDYIVRPLWQKTTEDDPIVLTFEPRFTDDDVMLLEYEVHACNAVRLSGGVFFFTLHSELAGEDIGEYPHIDPTGMIIGAGDGLNWLTRFYNFKLWENGEVVSEIEHMHEMTVSDSAGTPHLWDLDYPMEPGETLVFGFSASLRDENRPDRDVYFTLKGGASVKIGEAPSPNPHDRYTAKGKRIEEPQMIRIVH